MEASGQSSLSRHQGAGQKLKTSLTSSTLSWKARRARSVTEGKKEFPASPRSVLEAIAAQMNGGSALLKKVSSIHHAEDDDMVAGIVLAAESAGEERDGVIEPLHAAGGR